MLIKIFDHAGTAVSLGSGFLFDRRGRAITNHHVIDGATRAMAQFKDGSECEISGYYLADAAHDLAVVQLKEPPKSSKPLSFAKVDPQQGDEVIAIGHPKGYAFTVTTGIVSALRTFDDLPGELRDVLKMPQDGLSLIHI